MKEIKLSQWGKNRGKYVALVDDEDFEVLSQFKWAVKEQKHTLYAVRTIIFEGKQSIVRMHCAILNNKEIDHIDHNGLNNQKSNLRLCTRSENMMNTRKRESCISIYKGVCYNKRNKKWIAQIQINSKHIGLGYFNTEIEAAKAYNAKAVELFFGIC